MPAHARIDADEDVYKRQVHTLTIVGDSVGSDNLGDSVLAKVIGNAVVDGEQDLDARCV